MIAKMLYLIAVFGTDVRPPSEPTGDDYNSLRAAVNLMMSTTSGQGTPLVCHTLLHGAVNYDDLFSVRLQDPWDFCEKTRSRWANAEQAECTMPEEEGLWSCRDVSLSRRRKAYQLLTIAAV